MNWLTIGTIITAIAALVAAIIAAYQAYLFRFSNGVNLLMQLDERLQGEGFQKKRQAAARALSAALTVENTPDVEEVLDFFETIGHLTRRRALDKKFVHNTFFHVFYGYFLASETYIEQKRKTYPTWYDDLVWLKKELVKIEKELGGSADKQEWKWFLTEEVPTT